MAITGRGHFPFKSDWVSRRRRRNVADSLRKTVYFSDRDQSEGTILRDWFFDSVTPPAGTNLQVNIGDVFKSVAALKINIGDTWKDVVSVQINIGDTWKTVF